MNLAMPGALGRWREWEAHCKGAITNGVSREQIRAAIHAVAIHGGVPCGIECFRIARRAFADIGGTA